MSRDAAQPADATTVATASMAGTRAAPGALPRSALAVETAGAWREWWRAERAPLRWRAADARLADAVRWRATAPGVEVGEARVSGTGEAWRLRVIAVRLDPARVALRLHTRADADGRIQPWTVGDAPDDALVALNAGQFDRFGPWGWVVRDGVELRPPGRGPLAPAVVVDTAGRVRLVPAERTAFQSYPAILLGDGDVPAALQGSGGGVDVGHRDARLALGTLPDGRVLVALTRFEGLGGVLDVIPFGLTVPEMAAVMGALGARRAVLLDGGISGQLLVRERGARRAWDGLRDVPLGLIATPRD